MKKKTFNNSYKNVSKAKQRDFILSSIEENWNKWYAERSKYYPTIKELMDSINGEKDDICGNSKRCPVIIEHIKKLYNNSKNQTGGNKHKTRKHYKKGKKKTLKKKGTKTKKNKKGKKKKTLKKKKSKSRK